MGPIDNRTPNSMERLPLKSPEQVAPSQAIERGETLFNPEKAAIDAASQAEIAKSVASNQPIASGLPSELPKASLGITSSAQTTTVSTPLTASDDDRLPQEWIDAAKQIINSTKDEPHKRDDEVAKLKKDYQQKRYGVSQPISDKI